MRPGVGRRGRACLALFLALSASSVALAVQPDELMQDPAMEHRAREISSQLRCLVCQNQSIDDSDAPLARDLRLLVRARLRAGDSDAQAREYVVRRYGEFVLLRPVMALHTALLWFGPLALLVAGALGLIFARRRRGAASIPPLDPDERARLDDILSGGGKSGSARL